MAVGDFKSGVGYSEDGYTCWAWGCAQPATLRVRISFDGDEWTQHHFCAECGPNYAHPAPFVDIVGLVVMRLN